MYIVLDAVLVPTKKTKILPMEDAPHHTTNAMSLVINTAPSRMLAPITQATPPDQPPQVIKRNSIVPPLSGLNSSWPTSSVSTITSSSVSPLRTSSAIQGISSITQSSATAEHLITLSTHSTIHRDIKPENFLLK